jgi:hypothetical protein
VQAALEKAQIVIEKNRTINLTTRSAKVFFDAIEKPPKPTDKLARLAVAKNSQRQRYGTLMMVNAIERILADSKNLGIIGFFIDAKIEAARRYYGVNSSSVINRLSIITDQIMIILFIAAGVGPL